MIKAIVFDCFGVLTVDGLDEFGRRYFAGEDFIDFEANCARLRRGLISYSDLVVWLSAKSGAPSPDVVGQITSTVANQELFALIKSELSAEYKIGLLSNMNGDYLKDLFSSDQLNLFDEIALSYQVGAAKPDFKMYQAIADKLALAPEECLFIDDNQDYCAAAQVFGMKVLHFSYGADFYAQLKEVLNA